MAQGDILGTIVDQLVTVDHFPYYSLFIGQPPIDPLVQYHD
jgi:hypothetical protein